LGCGEGNNLRLVKSSGFRGWLLICAAALCVVSPGLTAALSIPARADSELEERKLPMRFSWVECQPNCHGWISAIGIVTADSPKDFDEFARARDLRGATVVLDSSGGSVNDAIALGRRWRSVGLSTTVGTTITTHDSSGDQVSVVPTAYCESMCVFLLLSGKVRYVAEGSHVRVHQIWMGDRADDARAASYTAQDMTIVERDIGRLAKFTFDMGGTGDLLSLALNVPPWEELHELSPSELRLTNLVTSDTVADVLPDSGGGVAVVAKPTQDRFVGAAADEDKIPLPTRPTKTAEAAVPTGGAAISAPTAPQR
jgi:hypothetical protein